METACDFLFIVIIWLFCLHVCLSCTRLVPSEALELELSQL